MKKFLSILMVIMMVLIPITGFAESADATIEDTISLTYGNPIVDETLLMNFFSGESEIPAVKALYLFVSEDSNILQYLDGKDNVYTWIIDNEEDSLAGLEIEFLLFNEVDAIVFFDVNTISMVVGSQYSQDSSISATVNDFYADIAEMYINLLDPQSY